MPPAKIVEVQILSPRVCDSDLWRALSVGAVLMKLCPPVGVS